MIAHFVGGPAHGTDQRVSRAERVVKFPKPNSTLPWVVSAEDFSRIPDFKVHEYRLLYTNARYAVYEWVPLKIAATWEFAIRDSSFSRELYDRLYNMTSEGEAVQVRGVECEPGEVRVRGAVLVDGPADATAAEEASAAVKQVIEQKLRGARIVAFALDLSEDA
jgi:hypothetical protein